DGQGRTRAGAIVAPSKSVDHAEVPDSATSLGELKQGAATALAGSSASSHSGAVEVALGVKGDALVGLSAIQAASEVVENGVNAGRCDLENCAAAVEAALHGRAVDVTGLIHDEVGVGVFAIAAS